MRSVSSMQTSNIFTQRARAGAAMLALIAPLALIACAPEGGPAVEPAPAPAEKVAEQNDNATAHAALKEGTAELVMAGESFSFELTHCAVGDTDILAGGPGQGNESGDPAYFDIDVVLEGGTPVTGGARIDLGTNEQFTSMDEFYSLNIDTGDYRSLMINGDIAELDGTIRFSGENDLGPGTFTVDCG